MQPKLLDDLPLSKAQRELYKKGVLNLSDEEVAKCTKDILGVLREAPAALAKVKELLQKL